MYHFNLSLQINIKITVGLVLLMIIQPENVDASASTHLSHSNWPVLLVFGIAKSKEKQSHYHKLPANLSIFFAKLFFLCYLLLLRIIVLHRTRPPYSTKYGACGSGDGKHERKCRNLEENKSPWMDGLWMDCVFRKD